jgi:hypothetical protein
MACCAAAQPINPHIELRYHHSGAFNVQKVGRC